MNAAAIIAEYNPFHKGHIHHINETRKITGADCVIALMSGNFVQRGEPAFAGKYTRARCALGYADLVLELPAVYAVSSAEGFASGAVSLLDSLGGIKWLSFGTEASPGDFDALRGAAAILAKQPPEYVLLLKEGLSRGMSFPAARAAALSEYCQSDALSALLSSPNNILAAEYVKALLRRNSPIKPLPVQRIGDYLDTTAKHGFASAAAARSLYKKNGMDGMRGLLDDASLKLLRADEGRAFPVYPDDLSSLLSYAIAVNHDGLAPISDVGEAFANKLCNAFCESSALSFEELAARLKSREITATRISRALLHILLDIKQEDADALAAEGYPSYARILGFNERGRQFLSAVKKTSSIPVISNCADAYPKLSPRQKYLFDKDILASRIYDGILFSKYKTAPVDDFRSRVITV